MLIKVECRFTGEAYINSNFIVAATKIQTSLDDEKYYRLSLLNGNYVEITPKAWEHIRAACEDTIEDPTKIFDELLKESEE